MDDSSWKRDKIKFLTGLPSVQEERAEAVGLLLSLHLHLFPVSCPFHALSSGLNVLISFQFSIIPTQHSCAKYYYVSIRR